MSLAFAQFRHAQRSLAKEPRAWYFEELNQPGFCVEPLIQWVFVTSGSECDRSEIADSGYPLDSDSPYRLLIKVRMQAYIRPVCEALRASGQHGHPRTESQSVHTDLEGQRR